ncbi:MAG: T9SS type A sorting domain-containing protein [Chlorobi bacterium]|nr:T9SS type A sorting domain-containing protein [Chlorobiota bacterium]
MKRYLLFFAVTLVTLFFAANTFAQLPQYYNYNTNGTNNSFPFNQAAGKMVQYLYLANDFNTPGPAPAGLITKFSFRIGDTYPLNSTYTNIYIRMGQTALTSFSGAFYAGTLDTVFKRVAGYTINAAGSTWHTFTLDNPFSYDPTMSLVVEIGQCGSTQGTGFSVCNTTVGANRRVWSVGGCPFSYAGQGLQIMNAGISVVPAVPQHYNMNTGTGVNTYPWGQPGQRVHWLITAGSLTQPTPLQQGATITAIYFWMGNTSSATFTDMTIRLGDESITALPPSWYAPAALDTVYYKPSVTLSSTNNAWMVIPLTTPFVYNVSQALIIDVNQCGRTPAPGLYVRQGSGATGQRNYGTPGTCPINYAGQDGQIMNFGVSVIYPTGINNNNNEIPNAYRLEQNYPNPFNPVTNIAFSIPKAGNVKLIVYDMLGREVAVLANGFKTAGIHSVDFDASALSSGVYLYKIEAGDFKDTKKMMLVK